MTISPTYLRLRGQSLIYAVTACCSIGFMLFGYDLGFMGGLSTSPIFLDQFGNPDAALLAFLISSYEIGAVFGAAFTFYLGDRYGRKINNNVGAIVLVVGATIQTSSYGVAQFIVGRLVAGFGLGIMTTVIPIWLAECAMPKSRGRMMAMQLSNLILGLVIANWLDYGMSSYTTSIAWRFPCAFQICLALITCTFMPFLPESPRYLSNKDNHELAAYNLAALRGKDSSHPDIDTELREIRYAIAVEHDEAGGWSDVFRDGGVSGFTRVALAFAANFFQQMSGVNVMGSLGPYIFQNSIGLTRYEALLVSGGLQLWYLLSSIAPWFLIDTVGRRKLFITGSIGMGICMMLSAIFVGIGTKALGYAAVVMLYLFQTFFTLGWQSNMWIYPPELLPLKLRSRGTAIAVIAQWLFTFLVVEITPPMITNIHYKTYIVFAIFNFVTVPLVYFCFPETSGLPLEAVDLLFADRTGARPSLFRVVKDSKNKDYVQGLKYSLVEIARERDAKKESVDLVEEI